jgi:hypothetical protein
MAMAGYCSMDVVRAISGLSTAQISDDILSGLMSIATDLFRGEVFLEVGGPDEDYEPLSPSVNDDTNKIFYVRHTPIVDMDCDGTITPTGDIEVYDNLKQQLPSSVTVDALDADTGKVTLHTATTEDTYAHYWYGAYPISSKEVSIAYAYLVSKMAWDRVIGTASSVRIGEYSVSRSNYFNQEWTKAKNKLIAPLMTQVSETSVKLNRESDYQSENMGSKESDPGDEE